LIVKSAVSELNFLQMKMSAISCFFGLNEEISGM